jgi:hypothetical protein
MTQAHVNPAVATGKSLNTKPVTKAKAKPTKAAAKAEVAKAPATPNMMTGLYPHLGAWPVDIAGPPPNDYDIARAVAFTKLKQGRASRKLIGAACALRPGNTNYRLIDCTTAQWLACGAGGTENDVMSNIVSDMVRYGYVRKLGKVQGMGFNVEVTPAGEKRWAEFTKANPAYDVPDPYTAESLAKAKKAVAAAKAKATKIAKAEAAQAETQLAKQFAKAGLEGLVEHVAPHHEATVAAGEVLPVEATPTAASTENAPALDYDGYDYNNPVTDDRYDVVD